MPVGNSVQKLWNDCGKFMRHGSVHISPTVYQHPLDAYFAFWMPLHKLLEINRCVACAALDMVAKALITHTVSTELCNTTTTKKELY